jgi:hypothetical protein
MYSAIKCERSSVSGEGAKGIKGQPGFSVRYLTVNRVMQRIFSGLLEGDTTTIHSPT